MKNILVLLTGGTVCSCEDENGVISVNGQSGLSLIENFKKSAAFSDEISFHLSENLFILSENMTLDGWNRIFSLYKDATKHRRFDGVIIAHGTDTLAYSASLFSLLFSKTEIPVFFVSSNAPLSSKRANGNENFKAAAECIFRGISPNVYVCYKNISSGKVMLHLASRLKQCENYSEDFESAGETDISVLTSETISEINKKFPAESRKEIPLPNGFYLKKRALYISPYVGMDYGAYNLNGVSAVLHGSYHSGTACAAGDGTASLCFLAKRCEEKGIPFYFGPAKSEGSIYLSADTIAKSGRVNFLYGATHELYLAKLTLAVSLFEKNEDIYNFMTTEFNFENGYL